MPNTDPPILFEKEIVGIKLYAGKSVGDLAVIDAEKQGEK